MSVLLCSLYYVGLLQSAKLIVWRCLVLSADLDSDSQAVCRLHAGAGDAVTVSVLQNNGRISPALPFVSYEACHPGTYNAWDSGAGLFKCQPCEPLQYSSTVHSTFFS